MRTLSEIAQALDAQRRQLAMSKLALGDNAGVTKRTLQHVLSGEQDFKVSTLLSIADRLGLELALVPRQAANALRPTTEPAVKSRIQAALDRVRGGRDS